MADEKATKEQIKRIYSLGSVAGLLDSSRGTDDELHLWVRSFAFVEHISDLTEKQANFVIARLKEYCNAVKDSRPVEAGMTEEQKRYAFKLMHNLVELSPSEVPLRDRFSGIIKAVIGKQPKKDLFFGMTMEQGTHLIETLKRYIRTEKRKHARKEEEANGNGKADKEKPP